MKQKRYHYCRICIIFSIFGASNLIFHHLSVTSGSEWLTSFLGFVLGDVGIILPIYAIAKCGDYQSIVGRAGKNFGLSLELMMLCLGQFSYSRTAATTFELSITPLIPGVNSVFSQLSSLLNPYINDSSNKSNGYYREVPNSCFINLSQLS